MWRHVIKWGVLAILTLFGMLVGCTMHSNTYDAERLTAETELVKARNQTEIEQYAAIERLIKAGVDPLEARCSILGTSNHGNAQVDICKGIALKK